MLKKTFNYIFLVLFFLVLSTDCFSKNFNLYDEYTHESINNRYHNIVLNIESLNSDNSNFFFSINLYSGVSIYGVEGKAKLVKKDSNKLIYEGIISEVMDSVSKVGGKVILTVKNNGEIIEVKGINKSIDEDYNGNYIKGSIVVDDSLIKKKITKTEKIDNILKELIGEKYFSIINRGFGEDDVKYVSINNTKYKLITHYTTDVEGNFNFMFNFSLIFNEDTEEVAVMVLKDDSFVYYVNNKGKKNLAKPPIEFIMHANKLNRNIIIMKN